jgi:predicted enzyme related to lactoylglutathione lyase
MGDGVAAAQQIVVRELSHLRQSAPDQRQRAKPVAADPSLMPAVLRHFAINASDVDAARRFYGTVFDLHCTPWGPPGFFHLDSGPADVQGALQQRRDLVEVQTRGFECTFAVDDVRATARAAVAAGGRVLMEPTTIEGVGALVWLADPDGNAVGAMQYEADAHQGRAPGHP